MSKFDANGIATRIRQARIKKRMSLAKLAAASGFTKSHIWNLETGRARNPTVEAVWAISGALSVQPAWLLGLETRAELEATEP